MEVVASIRFTIQPSERQSHLSAPDVTTLVDLRELQMENHRLQRLVMELLITNQQLRETHAKLSERISCES